MPEINLLKNEFKSSKPFSFTGRSLTSFYVVLGILVFELVIYGVLIFYERHMNSQAKSVEREAQSVDLEISKMDKDRKTAISFQRRLSNLEVLLDNHVFWTPLLEELSRFTFVNAQYESLQIDEGDNKIILTGNVPSYTEMGKLLLGLKQSPNIKDINLQSTGLAQEAVTGYIFTIEVIFDPKLLKK